MRQKDKYLPLFINISSKKIVVFGAGKVAERKVNHFLGSQQLIVVSKEMTEGLQVLWENDQIDHISASLKVKDDVLLKALIDQAFLVVPATSDLALNAKIKELANEANILCNDVSQAADVLVPSQMHSEEASIAITTYGSSPATLRYLRTNTDSILTPQVDSMIRVQENLRNYLKTKIDGHTERGEKLWTIINDQSIWEMLPDDEDGAFEKAKQLLEL